MYMHTHINASPYIRMYHDIAIHNDCHTELGKGSYVLQNVILSYIMQLLFRLNRKVAN